MTKEKEFTLLNEETNERFNIRVYSASKDNVINGEVIFALLENNNIDIFIDKENKFMEQEDFYKALKDLVRQAHNNCLFQKFKYKEKPLEFYYYMGKLSEAKEEALNETN